MPTCHTRKRRSTMPHSVASRSRANAPTRAGARAAHLQALEQALKELGLPETLVVEVEWRLKAVEAAGKIFGVMFPPCWVPDDLRADRVRRWDKNCPGRSWAPCQTSGCDSCTPGRGSAGHLVAAVKDKSPAPGVGGNGPGWATTAFKKGRAATRAGRDVVERPGASGSARGSMAWLLVVVIGEGKLVIPVDFTVAGLIPWARATLPRQTDLVAGDAGPDVGCDPATVRQLPPPWWWR